MSFVSDRLLRLVLTVGLAVGVAMFVGCGGSSSSGGGSGSGGGGDSSSSGGSGGGGGSDSGSVSIDHSTPEALFNSVLRAAEARDYRAIARAYPPSAQDEMSMGMVAMSTMTMMSPSTDKDAIRAVLEKHGINPEDLPEMGPQMQEQAQALADGIEDKAAFFGDIMGTIPEMQADAMRSLGVAEGAAVSTVTLTDIQIDGDSATGKVAAVQEGESDRTINFVREDGKWYMGLDG